MRGIATDVYKFADTNNDGKAEAIQVQVKAEGPFDRMTKEEIAQASVENDLPNEMRLRITDHSPAGVFKFCTDNWPDLPKHVRQRIPDPSHADRFTITAVRGDVELVRVGRHEVEDVVNQKPLFAIKYEGADANQVLKALRHTIELL